MSDDVDKRLRALLRPGDQEYLFALLRAAATVGAEAKEEACANAGCTWCVQLWVARGKK